MQNITIEPAMNGWIVKVGCGNPPLVSEDKTKMLLEISRYIDDPRGVEAEYRAKANNKMGGADLPKIQTGRVEMRNQVREERAQAMVERIRPGQEMPAKGEGF